MVAFRVAVVAAMTCTPAVAVLGTELVFRQIEKRKSSPATTPFGTAKESDLAAFVPVNLSEQEPVWSVVQSCPSAAAQVPPIVQPSGTGGAAAVSKEVLKSNSLPDTPEPLTGRFMEVTGLATGMKILEAIGPATDGVTWTAKVHVAREAKIFALQVLTLMGNPGGATRVPRVRLAGLTLVTVTV